MDSFCYAVVMSNCQAQKRKNKDLNLNLSILLWLSWVRLVKEVMRKSGQSSVLQQATNFTRVHMKFLKRRWNAVMEPWESSKLNKAWSSQRITAGDLENGQYFSRTKWKTRKHIPLGNCCCRGSTWILNHGVCLYFCALSQFFLYNNS